MNCEECKAARIAKEGEAWRQHQTIKWLIFVIALLIVMLFGSNFAWLYYESQFEEVSIEAAQDGSGTNIVGGGDIEYGTESKDDNPQA